MPPLSWSMQLSDSTVLHGSNLSASVAAADNATNPSDDGLKVICAWPVSGSYGAGSRVLFYVLVATTVFARRLNWIKSAALTTALPLSAAAAVHGIVLASLHRDKAVDMDVYGAFQMCAIGTLAIPLVIKLSRTHEFSTHTGRRIMFVWAALILTGLISLAIEFFRAQTFPCHQDNQGNPISSNPKVFPYGENTTCGLICSENDGPFSPIRMGSANNIYVIPAPRTLTFGTATLVAAACCIHTVIWMVVMTERFNTRADRSQIDEPISGTNGATKASMNDVNHMVHIFLSAAVIPVSGCAALGLVIVSEINFFSGPVNYQAESLASIGQWSTIVGTGLASLGALYILFAIDIEALTQKPNPNTDHDSDFSSSNRGRGSHSSEHGRNEMLQLTRTAYSPHHADGNAAPSFRRQTRSLPPPASRGSKRVGRDNHEVSALTTNASVISPAAVLSPS